MEWGRFRNLGEAFHVQATKYVYPWKQKLTAQTMQLFVLK